ncbi:hypothetical protein CPT_Silvanus_038 [Stenotrophomonas phage Silvanus]|nr:hypothetical protein CPT_Silvanus_038 [Stenotrophomonas phage Silvanus]
MMTRRIGLANRIQRRSRNGQHWYVDPILGMDSQPFDTVNEREEQIRLHYVEPPQCVHDWEELTRQKNRYERGMVSGVQRCRTCGVESFYSKGEDE